MYRSSARHSYENTWLWFAKIATGVAVFALLIIHLVVNHLVAEGGLLTYNDVLNYYAHPVIPIMEAAFLVFVVSHALLGVRGIVLDLHPAPRLVRALNVGLVIGGVSATGYGLWLLMILASRAS